MADLIVTSNFQSFDDTSSDFAFAITTQTWERGELLGIAVKGSLPSWCGSFCKAFINIAMQSPPGSVINSVGSDGM